MLGRGIVSLVNQTTPTAALDVLHYQHAEGGSGHSGTVSVARWNAGSHDSSPRRFYKFRPQICNIAVCTGGQAERWRLSPNITSFWEYPVTERLLLSIGRVYYANRPTSRRTATHEASELVSHGIVP